MAPLSSDFPSHAGYNCDYCFENHECVCREGYKCPCIGPHVCPPPEDLASFRLVDHECDCFEEHECLCLEGYKCPCLEPHVCPRPEDHECPSPEDLESLRLEDHESLHPGDLESLEDHKPLRLEARRERDRMNKCFRQRRKGNVRKDKRLAKKLLLQGQEHKKNMERLHKRASAMVFQSMNLANGLGACSIN